MRGHLIPVVSVLAACGAASTSGAPPASCAPAQALQTVASTSGLYSVSACSSTTPTQGQNAFALFVADANTGAPIEGLTLAVIPWMPDMGHGSPTTPAVSAAAGGLYDITDCVFTMGGLWQLRTTLSNGADGGADSAIVSFTID